jgi:sodium/bile acid cotransporter 7
MMEDTPPRRSPHALLSRPGRPARAPSRRPKGAVDWFLLGMVAAVIVASFAPDIGRGEGLLRLGRITDFGVLLLFFLHGLGMSTDSLKQGASRWKLHLQVQFCTFVAFPLWWALWAFLLGAHLPRDLVLGFFYLAVLPSTVSSSVAMTALARGHVAAAILNATLSTLLGVFLTPLLVSVVMSGAGHHFDMGQTMLKIATMMLLPFFVGHFARPLLAERFAKIKPLTMAFDRLVIVMLVWVAFSDSVADGLWRDHGPLLLAQAIAGALLFLLPMLWFTKVIAKRLNFDVEDEIVAVFCGSKKSMASGMPMAKLLFGGNAAMGVLVLPLLIYHQIQMFVCAMMARRYAARVTQRIN